MGKLQRRIRPISSILLCGEMAEPTQQKCFRRCCPLLNGYRDHGNERLTGHNEVLSTRQREPATGSFLFGQCRCVEEDDQNGFLAIRF